MTRELVVRAPGKLILLGEYAVLHGHAALVVAVDRYAECRVDVDGPPGVFGGAYGEFPFIDGRPAPGNTLPFARALLHARKQRQPAVAYHLSTDALHVAVPGNAAKLGLGSSAAATVALAGAVLAVRGVPLDARAQRRVFRSAQIAHRMVQGSGSGADVAASSLGGALAYQWFDNG
ncbi:MAG: hypothetical protein KC620_17500, partial [Myxococcales bacterium]|nr:hypothetical protein [Myxococcales bacterium]